MVELKLTFDNEEERADFVAGLLDGWGEGAVYATWADGKTPYQEGMDIHISNIREDDEEG